jgi:hypothetical protein
MVVFPPVAEQLAIAKHLDNELSGIESAISSVERQVSFIREYRTRLVADVVTGQLDVRGVSLPPLPDSDTEDPEAELDDADPQETAEALDEE